MHLGLASARLLVSCTYGFGVVRRTYDALRWKAHGDRGADANLALHVEGTAVQFDKGFDQRQAKAGPFIFAVEVAVDLLECVGKQSWYLAELWSRVAGAIISAAIPPNRGQSRRRAARRLALARRVSWVQQIGA